MSLINTVQASKLVVGLDALPNVPHSGQAFLNGPVVIGNPVAPSAALSVILPSINAGALTPIVNGVALNIVAPTTGAVVTAPTAGIFNGTTIVNGTKITNGSNIKNGTSIVNGIKVNNDVKITNGAGIVNSSLIVNGNLTAASANIPVVNGYATGNKPVGAFDIPHWKNKNKRIRHICTEGPEAGIYIRGKLKGNKIYLPEYWEGLVDIDTISVNLTPIGRPQNCYVKSIQYGRQVLVYNEDGSTPECFYQIWVARWIDPTDHEEKLHVVYEGESPKDYPGDPKNFLVGGWDYDRRDPNWGPSSQSVIGLD